MKVFQNKSLFKKLIFILVLITIVSFCIPKGVSANDNVLLKPITSLFLTLGDGAVQIIHSIILQQNETLLNIDIGNDLAEGIFTVLVAVAIAIIVAVAVVATSGAIAAALATAGVTIGTMSVGTVLLISIGTGTVAGVFVNSKFLDNNIKLPIYNISPEEIFSNSIPTFDVDFFNPQEGIVETQEVETKPAEYETKYKYQVEIEKLQRDNGMPELKDCIKEVYFSSHLDDTTKNELISLYNISDDIIKEDDENNEYYYMLFIWNYNNEYYLLKCNCPVQVSTNAYWNCYKASEGTNIHISGTEGVDGTTTVFNNISDRETVEIEVAPAETEEVVSREVPSTAAKLRSTISNWYIILRNIALVALLSVLVYVGIRILISSTSSDKAKYKQMLLDWIVAVCLLFIMQYIMSFSNLLVEKVTDLLSSAEKPKYLTMVPDVKSKVSQAITSENNEKILKQYGIIPKDSNASDLSITLADNGEETENGETYIQWNTNLMGVLRLKAQESKNETLEYTGYMMMFVMLVLFTVYFVFTYLKRVLYMAFLTVIAPLVAMTYPIDKMNDGKAQAFNMWFKEYIFNLLIQPLHLLLYTVLVSSAIDFARTNMIYSLVAIAFMMPAEKLMRKFFGFEKAQTPGMLGGAAGAALAWSGINKLMGHRPPKHNEKGNAPKGENISEGNNLRTAKYNDGFDKDKALLNDKDKGITKNKDNFDEINTGLENKDVLSKELDNDKPDNTYANSKSSSASSSNSNLPNSRVRNKQLSSINTANNKKRKIKNKHIRAAIGGTKHYLGGMGKKIVKGVANSHPLRTATGVASAATFAMAGGIVGLSSGDPSKVAQYAALGASGGYNFGKGMAQSASSALDVSGTYEAAERAKYDSEQEYRRAQVEKQIENMKKNKEFINYTEQILGEKQAEEMFESDFVDNLGIKGITDQNELIAAYQLKNEKDLSDDEAAAYVKYAKLMGDTSKMHTEDQQKWYDTVHEKLKAKGASDEIARNKTKEVMDSVKIYYKYKNDI